MNYKEKKVGLAKAKWSILIMKDGTIPHEVNDIKYYLLLIFFKPAKFSIMSLWCMNYWLKVCGSIRYENN